MNYDVLLYAETLLAQRMYAVADLKKKLEKKFNDVEEVVQNLLERNILNDEDYVRAYLEYEVTTHFRGKMGYWKKLIQKGIERDVFDMVWEDIAPNELKMAEKLLEQNAFRFENLNKKKRREKMQRFLVGRGFSFDVIAKIVSFNS